ncbi:MAG: NADP-dependent fatty aldehyde dehydrogenase, partial [Verrucomicrobiota bacterium]
MLKCKSVKRNFRQANAVGRSLCIQELSKRLPADKLRPMSQSQQFVLIAGQWREAKAGETFRAENPATCEKLPEEFLVSTWADCDSALNAAAEAATILCATPPEQIAKFLTRFADRMQSQVNFKATPELRPPRACRRP